MILIKMSIQNIDFCKYLPSIVCLASFVGAAKLLRKCKSHTGQDDLCDQVEKEVDLIITQELTSSSRFNTECHFTKLLQDYTGNQCKSAEHYTGHLKTQMNPQTIQQVAGELIEFFNTFDEWHCGLNQLKKFNKVPL